MGSNSSQFYVVPAARVILASTGIAQEAGPGPAQELRQKRAHGQRKNGQHRNHTKSGPMGSTGITQKAGPCPAQESPQKRASRQRNDGQRRNHTKRGPVASTGITQKAGPWPAQESHKKRADDQHRKAGPRPAQESHKKRTLGQHMNRRRSGPATSAGKRAPRASRAPLPSYTSANLAVYGELDGRFGRIRWPSWYPQRGAIRAPCATHSHTSATLAVYGEFDCRFWRIRWPSWDQSVRPVRHIRAPRPIWPFMAN